MMRIRMDVDNDIFEDIKKKGQDELEKQILERIAELEKCMDRKNQKELKEKRDRIWNKIEKMNGEIKELRSFIEKAKKDQKIMEEWIYRLGEENKSLLEKLKEIW